jgi:hypothetical protein
MNFGEPIVMLGWRGDFVPTQVSGFEFDADRVFFQNQVQSKGYVEEWNNKRRD